jgi:U6 snRNA-associated Sm-like protein LSm7
MSRKGDKNAPKKENILDLSQYIGKEIYVKFNGGREGLVFYVELTNFLVKGILRGSDALVNLVLDSCVEYLRDPDDLYKKSNATRQLGTLLLLLY